MKTMSVLVPNKDTPKVIVLKNKANSIINSASIKDIIYGNEQKRVKTA